MARAGMDARVSFGREVRAGKRIEFDERLSSYEIDDQTLSFDDSIALRAYPKSDGWSTSSMQMIILGTDHELQCYDQDLKGLIMGILARERVTFVAEENRPMSNTIARQVSDSAGLRWIQIDMSIEDRIKAGIDGKLLNRMQLRYDACGDPTLAIRYAPVEDGIREEFWLDRIQEAGVDGTGLVICGCLHCLPLAEKAEKRGHKVLSKIFHPERLSELKPELY